MIILFLKFIRYIPGFFRLYKAYEMNPEDIRYSLEQYQSVLHYITNGRMSKLGYSYKDIIQEVQDVFCDQCDLKDCGEE